MKPNIRSLQTCFCLLILLLFAACSSPEMESANAQTEQGPGKQGPAEHFYQVRSFPDHSFDREAFQAALEEAKNRSKTQGSVSTTPWTVEGPGNIGGRINAIAVDPNNSSIVLAGCASGGIFRTTNNGATWTPIFEDAPLISISDITFAPGNSDVIYAATGDRNISGYPFIGDGLYKSTDGGTTWNYSSLRASGIVSRILVDHTNPDILYAGTMGKPFVRNNDRGLYRSSDAGATWTKVLFVSNQAGIIDLHQDPSDANILYASSWDRIRTNQESITTGPGSGVWKSSDRGLTWTRLTNGLPSNRGRINLTLNPQNTQTLYASVVDTNAQLAGIYVTHDAGQSWSGYPTFSLNQNALGGFGWYFADIFLNPFDTTELFFHGIQLWRTRDGGISWYEADPPWYTYEVHADKHDMVFNGADDIIIATDGGLYRTTDGGFNWYDYENIPNTQFYRVGVNPHKNGIYYGGAQDNGTTDGNASTFNSWSRLYGGDGFTALYDNDPDHVVYETQNGGLVYSENAGQNIIGFTTGLDFADRRNWDMPVILSQHNNNRYYTGTHRVYRNNNGLSNHLWNPISPDLTDGNIFGERYHTLSAVEESPINPDLLYAGATDGNVSRTTNQGSSWSNVSSGIPKRYVTSVRASHFRENEVFVTVSGYKYNDLFPHVLYSDDRGNTWNDISGNLPNLALNDILLHPTMDSVLVVASDGGCYVTRDMGQIWERIGNNMPFIPVYDMAWDTLNQKLIAGTHARSIWSFPTDSLTQGSVILAEEPHAEADLRIYPNPTTNYLRWELPYTVSLRQVELYQINGQKLKEWRQPSSIQSVSVDDLPPGTYLIRLISTRSTWTRKFVKL